jgi:ubiquinone biosynthesis protein
MRDGCPETPAWTNSKVQIEGLGRQLDPDLDLRRTAQPILERFMSEQMGVRGFLKQLSAEAPLWAQTLPQIPRLVHLMLTDEAPRRLERAILDLERAQARQTRMLAVIAGVLAVLVVGVLVRAATG